VNKESINIIIEACQHFDPKAQKQLYDLFVDRLYFIVLRYTNDKYYIENILQDTFLKIFNNISRYDHTKGAFTSWIKVIAIRESINHLRKNKIVFSPLTIVENTTFNVVETFSKMNVEEILHYVSKIPDKYRVIFNMYEIDGYKHREIAETLGISEGTSRAYLTRSKKMIKKEFLNIHFNKKSKNG